MITIKFFSSWLDDKATFDIINSSDDWNCDDNYNVKYKLTYNDDYTHAILLNNPTPSLNIPKENVIGLAQEPINILHVNVEYCNKHVSK